MMTINMGSWHYRWYAYWLVASGGNKPNYKENLCHYMRVLVFWAPLCWLGSHTPTSVFKQILSTICLLYIGGVVFIGIPAAIVLLAIFEPWALAILGVLILGALAATLLLMFLYVTFIEGHPVEVPGTVKLVGSYVMAKKRRICPFLDFGEPS